MEILGYVCSPLCKQKAELRGIEVPEYELQKSVVERRRSRKMGLVFGSAAAVIVLVLGVWFWWAWFGQKPTAIFATRFEKPAYSGASALCGDNQIVFLHGSTLARHDLGQKKELWSANLMDKAEIARKVEKELKALHELQDKLNSDAPDAPPVKIPSPEKLARELELSSAASLELRVVGQNIWVQSPGKIVHYDWDTGKVVKELKVEGGFGGFLLRGDELLMFDEKPYRHIINHINLVTADMRKEVIVDPERPDSAVAKAATNTNAKAGTTIASRGKGGGAGLPTGAPGKDGGKPLDAKKVEQQYSRLSIPGRLAYPAVLAVQRGQERALAEMNGPNAAEPEEAWPTNQFTFIPAKGGYVEYEAHMIEHRVITHEAVKVEGPKKSALDGPVTAGNSIDVASQMLNEMQRERGGGTITEDASRYKVTLRRAPDGKISSPDDKTAPADTKPSADSKGPATASNETTDDCTWVGEVIGHPSVFALKTVNVVAAKKLVIVLDKNNKKLWQAELVYDVDGYGSVEDDPRRGQGPCVERDNTLFVFDEGMLTSFDLKTGTKRWRLPSVGITGLFFDDDGKLYVNTSTASPDALKFSRTIDLNRNVTGLLLKMDPLTGKTLWSRELNGDLAYVSGKYLITMQSYWPPDYDEEEENPYRMTTGMETDPFIRLRRINPRNGKDLWVHFQLRCPVDVQFEKNRIHLVFKKEVQVLKFRSL
jgi:hypothetical protein